MKAEAIMRHAPSMRGTPKRRPAWVWVAVWGLGSGPGCLLEEEAAIELGRGTTSDDDQAGASTIAAGEGPLDTSDHASTTDGGSDAPLDPDLTTTTGAPPDPMSGSITDGGTSDDGMGEDASTGPTVFGGDCCVAHVGVGCDDPMVESCVCDVDPYCCEASWDELCVDLMEDLECMLCAGTVPPAKGDCCMGSMAEGCLDASVQTCVCDSDPYCCQVMWDDACASQVEMRGCGYCGSTACCVTAMMPGCIEDPMIETCVCASDPFCCDSQWDGLCVDGVTNYGCGTCPPVPPPQPGDCCLANNAPGCDDPAIMECVCPADPFCCDTAWDQLCVNEVDTLGCGTCFGDPTGGTDGMDSGGFISAGSDSGGSDSGSSTG